jgi:hypothetical protein
MRQRSDERRHPVRHPADGHEAAQRSPSSEETATSASTDHSQLDADIRRRAYERYVARGGGPGSDVEDWCAAERELREARRTTEGATPARPDGEEAHSPRGHRAGGLRAARVRRDAGRRETPRGRPA